MQKMQRVRIYCVRPATLRRFAPPPPTVPLMPGKVISPLGLDAAAFSFSLQSSPDQTYKDEETTTAIGQRSTLCPFSPPSPTNRRRCCPAADLVTWSAARSPPPPPLEMPLGDFNPPPPREHMYVLYTILRGCGIRRLLPLLKSVDRGSR